MLEPIIEICKMIFLDSAISLKILVHMVYFIKPTLFFIKSSDMDKSVFFSSVFPSSIFCSRLVQFCFLPLPNNHPKNKISFLLFSKTFSTTDNMILWLLHIVSSSISLLDFKSSFLLLFMLYIQEGFQFNIEIIITNPISYQKQYFVLL